MEFSARVLIVGGGPVGLTMAMDLADRGIEVIVADPRLPGEPPSSVKCNHVSARSMEIYRQLGIAKILRSAGLPDDYPNDVVFATTATGIELSRIPIPSRRERYTSKNGPDTWWPTPEPPHRINQIYMEPLLFEHAYAKPNVRVLNQVFVESFTQDESCAVAFARHVESGNAIRIECDFIVGCDGPRSTIRKEIGASFVGTDEIHRVQTTYIRAPGLLPRLPAPPPWAVVSLNPRRVGNTFAIDGREKWLVHNYLVEGENDFDAVDRDLSIRQILGVGADFPIEIISKQDYIGRRLVADKFRNGRAFICGDAAHIWIPMGGYGLNAGIADAINLSWLLAAHLNGWAPLAILDAYEAERKPVTEQVSKFAMDAALKYIKQRTRIPLEIENTGVEDDATRQRIGKAAYSLNVPNYCCGGLNFGYFYDESPIISYDGATHPGFTMYDFKVSTVPGCRTPHIWLPDSTSLYDHLSSGFTLLRSDQTILADGLVAAARARNVPFEVLDIPVTSEYDYALVLSRPDRHIAWRGDSEPSSPLGLIDLIRGAG